MMSKMRVKFYSTGIALCLTLNASVYADTLLNNYTIAPRNEPYGVEDIGYPQICMRVNLSGERIDMQGVLDELSEKNRPEQLLSATTNLAASGKLGHVWTLFFDSKDSWRSWSFRAPSSPLGNALNYKHAGDSPQRNFNYQYCVSAKGKNIDSQYLLNNPIKKLINESRETAASLMPGVHLPEGSGIYSSLTPCVWFAVKLFNMITGDDVPYEQPINGKKLASIMNDPVYENLDSTVDASVVAEAISKKIKYAFGMKPSEQYMYLHNRYYLGFNDKQDGYYKNIASNIYYDNAIGPFYNITKTAILNGDDLLIVGYNGLLYSYNLKNKKIGFKEKKVTDFFPMTNINPKKITSTMPIYKGMPYFNEKVNQHLIFTLDGDVYLAIPEKKSLMKIDYFDQVGPHLKPYVKRVLGTSISEDGGVFIYLTKNKFIKIDPLTMDILKDETDMRYLPGVGSHFKLQ